MFNFRNVVLAVTGFVVGILLGSVISALIPDNANASSGASSTSGIAVGKAWRYEAPERRVIHRKVSYAESDIHGSPGMIIEFNNRSVWWFPACKHEDSRNCSWNAQTAGNKRGKSFVNLRGNVYYIPKRFYRNL